VSRSVINRGTYHCLRFALMFNTDARVQEVLDRADAMSGRNHHIR
jgi:hypothetical protein